MLREQGLTGMRTLEIDKAPPDLPQLTPKITFHLHHPLISSYPSEMEQLKSALEDIYTKVRSLDLDRLTSTWTTTGERINAVLATLDTAINPQEWQEIAEGARRTTQESALFLGRLNAATPEKDLKKGLEDLFAALAAGRTSSESLARQLKALPPQALAKMAGHWNTTLSSGGDTLASVDQQIRESAVLLQQTLHQVQILLTQVTALAQTLREQPNRLLFSPKAPDPFERK
jgi:phospholipid/cholesterol/gamma-HCH transport system substrate-binding protein